MIIEDFVVVLKLYIWNKVLNWGGEGEAMWRMEASSNERFCKSLYCILGERRNVVIAIGAFFLAISWADLPPPLRPLIVLLPIVRK